MLAEQATYLSYIDVFAALALFAALMVPLAFLLKTPKRPARPALSGPGLRVMRKHPRGVTDDGGELRRPERGRSRKRSGPSLGGNARKGRVRSDANRYRTATISHEAALPQCPNFPLEEWG